MKEIRKSYIANDLSKVKLIKDESKYYDKSSDADTTTLDVPSLSFFTLFRFASATDKFYIFLAIIYSIICGCMTPINILLFSSFLQSMVNYGKSNAENHPEPEVFLGEVRDFAIYSSVVGAIIVILSYAATVLMNMSAFNQVYRIRQEYFKSALNQDFQYFDTHQTGDFASKMTDNVVKLEDGIGEKLATFIFYQTSFISSIVMALVKGSKLALLCLILFPVPLFLVGIAGGIGSTLSKKEATALEKAGVIAEEVLSAIRTVYAFSGQQKEIERYDKCLMKARGINIRQGFFNGMATGTLFFCIFSAYAFSFWFGYKLMVDESEIYDVETMIAVIFGVIMGSINFGISSNLMEVFGNARGAGEQIFNLIDNIPFINPLLNIGIKPENIEGNVELKNVVFQYPSRPGVTAYNTLVGERGASPSGGQKQRIAIARALVRNPRILLLDEATSTLDTSPGVEVQEALEKAQQGRTTIFVAHRLSTIRNVDKIYVFKSGDVVESGNHNELMTKKGHYYDMITLQASPDITETEQGHKFNPTLSVLSERDEDEHIETRPHESRKATSDPEISFFQVVKLCATEWKSFTAASICALVSGFAMPLLAVILGDLIGILSNPDRDIVTAQVLRYSLMILGVGILSGITNFVMVSMYGVAGECLTARLRKLLFEKMLQQKVEFYDDKNNSTGALCARLSGDTAAIQGATQTIGTLLQAVGTFSFALGVSLYYEERLGLVALAFIPFMAAILYKQDRMVTAKSFDTSKTMESNSKIAVEAIANIHTVASLGCKQSFLNDYATQLLPVLATEKLTLHWRGIVFGLSRGLINFMYAVTLYYGANLMVYHRVGYDIILSSAQSLLIGSSAVAQVFLFAPNVQKGIKAAGRVIVMLGRDSKIVDPVKPAVENFKGTGEANIQNVQFKYPTRPLIQVLQNLNFEIENGKTIALVGSSGCGKSTIIQLLERYYNPDEGIVNGIPLTKLRLVDVRQSIGFVQQEPILFDRTIGENIAYGDNSRKVSMDEIIEVAKQTDIHNFIVSLPMGYETNIGSKGTQLSEGQKQRIAIARALIRRPKMLLLDEATSALDTKSEKVDGFGRG